MERGKKGSGVEVSGERERSGRGAGRSSGGTFVKPVICQEKPPPPFPPSMFALNTPLPPDRALCLLTLSHFLNVNKTSLSPPPPALLFFVFCAFLRLFAPSFFCPSKFGVPRRLFASACPAQTRWRHPRRTVRTYTLTHTTNRFLTGFASAEEIEDGVPGARGLTRPCFSAPFQAVGNRQKQLVSVLCTLGNKSTMVFQSLACHGADFAASALLASERAVLQGLACHGADFGGSRLLAFEPVVLQGLDCHLANFEASALLAFERVGLPPLVAPMVLIPFLEGANVSFLQHLIEFLKVS